MRAWPAQLIAALWLLWMLFWLVAALSTKPAQRRESPFSRLAFLSSIVVVAVLLVTHRGPAWLQAQLVPGGWTRYGCAVVLVAAGLVFSVWARIALGRNWSGSVTVKLGHELVQRGPYRYIRHPIYTGVLLALFGSGLAAGRVHGVLAFALAFIALGLKARREESWMTRQFGERYVAYRRASWALIPYVL